MLPVLISLLIVSVFLFYKYWISVYTKYEKRGIPTIPGKFPYGSSPELEKSFIGEVVQEMYYKMSEHPYFGIYMVRIPWIIVKDPEIIRLVVAKEFYHFRDRNANKVPKHDRIRRHLVNLHGEQWRALRVKLTPTFTSGKMKGMFPLFLSCAESFKKLLKSKVDMELDLKPYCAGYTSDTITSCAFGLEPNNIDNSNHDIRKLISYFHNRNIIFKILYFASKIFPRLKSFLREIPIEVEEYVIKMVGDTVEYREKNNVKRNDFLDLLIQLKNKGTVGDETNEEITEPLEMNIDLLASQTFVFLFSGMESSSTVQNWCLYELALHQDIQQRLREEIDTVLEKHGEVTYQAIQEMAYLHMVISETLRKYPVFPMLNRVCTAPFTMPNGDRIEKGDNIYIPVFPIHHDPQHYPDPEKFDPERFSPENIGSIKPFTYMPFGEGPRMCIGNRFGLLQSKMGVMTVISNFKVLPCDRTPKTIEFKPLQQITHPKEALFVKLVSRD